MKKILIAIDYAANAMQVAEQGFALAKSMNATVTLLHVISDDNYYYADETSPVMGFSGFSGTDFTHYINTDGLIKAAGYYLEKFKTHLGDDAIETIIERGDFAEVILQKAKHLKVDMIVLGSHSRRWFETILMGNVTEEVLNKTTIPLFIIPTKNHHTK